MRLHQEIFGDLLTLFFPENCAGCKRVLHKFEKGICLHCKVNLPVTHFHEMKDNPVEQILWGRFPFEYATSFLFFEKESIIQHMMHKLKYKGDKEVGYELGLLFGKSIKNAPIGAFTEAIVPVPLHPKKLKIRGFNQAEVIGEGISEGMGKPILRDLLVRNTFTSTQTKKSRIERYENMQNVFSVNSNVETPFTKFLLVDDVLTTGATLEGCAEAIINQLGAKVSVGTLAVAFN